MSKVTKGEESRDSAKKSREDEPVLDVNAAAAELEQDELARFKQEQKAQETEGIVPVVHTTVTQKPTSSSVPPAEFDWSAFDQKGFGEGYTTSEHEKLTQLYSGTIATVSNAEVVKVVVVGTDATL